MRKLPTFSCCLLSVGLLALAPAGTLAADWVGQANSDKGLVESFWTPERFQNAQPLPMTAVGSTASANDPEEYAEPAGPAVSAAGRAPSARVRPDLKNRLFEPWEDALDLPGSVAETASGSAGAYFTSARLVPSTADLAYPYSTVGKLFFTIPGRGEFYCSASVLRQRVVLTAAQCIHSGTSSPGFYTNFRFVPAYRNGTAPFGTWDWAYVAVSSGWTTSGGVLPNAADYGMIEVQDEVINGSLRRLGEVVGFLGYQTQKLRPNHAHLLAYTSSFDSGERMHQVTAQAFRAASQSNAEYGSDMRNGSGGGPLIQDFGDNPILVKVIGVLSYFNTATGVKLQGASTPDTRFTNLVTQVCAHRAGNC
ncbi:MAG: trypsin-like serine peptidase [Thermoanaerobaculia bacterium]